MAQHAVSTGRARGPKGVIAAVLAWHDRRPRASLDDARGWWWAALVAALFVWMSNPTVLVPSFYLSLGEAMSWTKVVVVLSLPWLRLPRVPWPWIVFLALAYLSQTWTINDFHTDVSDIVYLELTVLALVVAANCEVAVVAWGMSIGGAAVTLLSAHAYRQDMPGASYMVYAGEDLVRVLAGIGMNENILAYTVCISLAATVAIGVPRTAARRLVWAILLLANAYGLYLADSGTGYLAALLLVALALAVAGWQRVRPEHRRWAVVASAVVVGLLAIGVVGISTALGKQISTFSGRSPFWKATIAESLDTAPWFGSGWGAVWEHPWDPTPANEVSLAIYARAGYPLVHGHNLLLDVLPELGIVGVLAALCMVGYALNEARRKGVGSLSGRLVLLVVGAIVLAGITEPLLTAPVGWFSLCAAVGVSRQRQLPRSVQPSPAAATPRGGRRAARRTP